MSYRVRLLALMGIAAWAAFAQDAPRPAASTSGVLQAFTGPVFLFSDPIVTGAPYSAEETGENVQTLTDGTHITQKQVTTKFYRDSEGRTRTERWFPRPFAKGQTD
jgi:hypothetical protein